MNLESSVKLLNTTTKIQQNIKVMNISATTILGNLPLHSGPFKAKTHYKNCTARHNYYICGPLRDTERYHVVVTSVQQALDETPSEVRMGTLLQGSLEECQIFINQKIIKADTTK